MYAIRSYYDLLVDDQFDTDATEQLHGRGDILQMRHIADAQWLIRQ